jgi:CheY-like chemotaxis protein
MVYGFVKQSGGHVKIYSEPSIGTTVKLYLPEIAGSPEQLPPTAAMPDSLPSGTETILVVEDEEDVRQLACRVLAGLGYRIIQAADGKSALAVLAREPVDLLFTDVVLPGGLTGPQIAEQARARRPELPVLYTSGYTGNAIQQLEGNVAAVRLISKPYAIEELALMVRTALDQPA